MTALGPSGKKADYSNYTTEPRSGEVELSAPGGWFRDGFGTPTYRTNQNEILSTAPLKSLQEDGLSVDAERQHHPDGEALGVIKQCQTTPARAPAVRLLRVAAGHLDGQPARHGRRRARGRAPTASRAGPASG